MRKLYRGIVLALAFAVFSGAAAHAQSDDRRKAVMEFIQATGAANTLGQIITVMSQQAVMAVKQDKPDLPAEVWKILYEELETGLKAESPAVMTHMVQIYEKVFTAQELRDMTAFYKTPTGQKSIKVLPQVLQESAAFSQHWAQGVVPKIMQRAGDRLAKAGYKL